MNGTPRKSYMMMKKFEKTKNSNLDNLKDTTSSRRKRDTSQTLFLQLLMVADSTEVRKLRLLSYIDKLMYDLIP